MSDERKRSFLSVVSGAGEGDGRRVASLYVFETSAPAAPRQLNLVGVPARPATLVSLGMDGIDFDGFLRIIHEYGIRRIMDIRLLAAFRGRGFEATTVFEMFRQRAITYERSLDLGNRFIGESANEHVVFDKFLTHLKASEEPLRRLQSHIEQGPLLLLGRAAEHRGSERDAVVQALAHIGADFDLVTDPGGRLGAKAHIVVPAWHPEEHKTKTPARKAEKRKTRTPSRSQNDVQQKLKLDG